MRVRLPGTSRPRPLTSPSFFVGCTGVLVADAMTAPGGFRWAHVVAAVPGSRVKITLAAIIVFVVLECTAYLWLSWWRVAPASHRIARGSRRWCSLCRRCVLRRSLLDSHHALSTRECSSPTSASSLLLFLLREMCATFVAGAPLVGPVLAPSLVSLC
jgi:hypothetical protein